MIPLPETVSHSSDGEPIPIATEQHHVSGQGGCTASGRHAVRQRIFTVVTRVDRVQESALRDHLANLDSDAAQRKRDLPFETISALHFCSFTIFGDERVNEFGPYLVFESNIDGSADDYLDIICDRFAPALHAIYRHCPDYAASSADAAQLRGFLHKSMQQPDAAFVGNVGRSVQRIRQEAALVEHIQKFLDQSRFGDDVRPYAIVAAIRQHVREDAAWNWVWQVRPRISVRDIALRWAALLALAGSVLAVGLACPAAVAIFFAILRRHERTDLVDIPGPRPADLERLLEREDRFAQNHMASLCYVKAGRFRRYTLKAVLFAVNVVARISIHGRLLGLDSLHFAHWALIDNDRRLLFLTNYDGSWENYLDDFIDRVAPGLTAIWSNTLNFPRTRNLICGGARNERQFKDVSRTTQACTNLWYCAYPGLTVTNIENNSAICDGLSRPLEGAAAAAWLARF